MSASMEMGECELCTPRAIAPPARSRSGGLLADGVEGLVEGRPRFDGDGLPGRAAPRDDGDAIRVPSERRHPSLALATPGQSLSLLQLARDPFELVERIDLEDQGPNADVAGTADEPAAPDRSEHDDLRVLVPLGVDGG